MNKNNSLAVFILSVIVVIETVALLILGFPKPPHKVSPPAPPVAPVHKAGKIAIILDDWGYSLNNVEPLQNIHVPLTLAILPNLAHSKEIAQHGVRLGDEVILHLPSEPHEKIRLEKRTVLTSMNSATIREIVRSDLNSLQFAKGASNHMGSKVTEDPSAMAAILTELKNQKLYFLDSFVTSKSVGYTMARSMGLPVLKRDVFLDNEEDPEYIRGQLNKLKNKARMYGQAVGIGHDRYITVQVLENEIPQMQKEGFEFVPASDLAR
ncbi:MAG TPA: divergent polysaccharide deacetylase family protein [Candidatus Omnitrophota bacterium]|nr:divergent polysaccharide deacetylase family protein [Candidatus Omnitrophota bacterium]HNX81983.1 divergent polysaccharide deacetylase family protein [Candidatus Omnitrophota bacterium]